MSKLVTGGGRPLAPTPEQLQTRGGSFEGLDAYVQLMQRCWAHDPAGRPSFQDIAAELRCGIKGVQCQPAGAARP